MKNIVFTLVIMSTFCFNSAGQRSEDSYSKFTSQISADKIQRSTLIIEGRQIKIKHVAKKISENQKSGDAFAVIMIQPTALIKGTCDSSKKIQILIPDGRFQIQQDGSMEFRPVMDNTNPYFASYGIYFLEQNNNQLGLTDLYPDVECVNYIGILPYGNYYNTTRAKPYKEKALLFLDQTYGLKPIVVFDQVKQDKENQFHRMDSLSREQNQQRSVADQMQKRQTVFTAEDSTLINKLSGVWVFEKINGNSTSLGYNFPNRIVFEKNGVIKFYRNNLLVNTSVYTIKHEQGSVLSNDRVAINYKEGANQCSSTFLFKADEIVFVRDSKSSAFYKRQNAQ